MSETTPIGAGRARQAEVSFAGLASRRPTVPVDAARLEDRARAAMSTQAFAYIAGGAGLETTMARNRAAFDDWRIVPRMLRDVSHRDLGVELFGRKLPTPFLLAPVGVLELAHRHADLAAARAAAAEGVPFIFSSQASVAMEACAAAMGEAPRWFQLYWSASDSVAESFVRRAEGCGCEAIVLTLDTTMLGWRDRDLDLGYAPFFYGKGIAQYTSDPVFMGLVDESEPASAPGRPSLGQLRALLEIARTHPGGTIGNLRSPRPRTAVRRFFELFSRPELTWDDLPRLLELTELPVLLKGGSCRPTTHGARCRRGWTGSSSRTTVAARWTGRSARSMRCPPWWTPSPDGCPCCSTAACAAERMRSRRWLSAPVPCSSGALTPTGLPLQARRACTR